MVGDHRNAPVPMNLVIAKELEIYGSHGMQAYQYDLLMQMIQAGKLAPQQLIGKRINLEQAVIDLPAMDSFQDSGLTIIDRFG
jgi:alcohol dehydrogenase